MQIFVFYLAKKGILSSNKIDNSSQVIQEKLIQFKSNPIKKSSKIVNNFEDKIDNNNSNSSNTRNIKENSNQMNKETQKLSFDKFITHKKENVEISGKISSERKLNPKQKVNNSLIIGNITEANVEEYIKTDPNDMDFDNAIGRDKRTFCIYFVDNVKTDLLILNIFFNYEQLNPWPIKILLFILNIDLYFFVNGLFFTEDYLSEMLYDKNVNFFDFASRFIDRIYYITLIGIIISYVMDCFFFEERVIRKIFKRNKDNVLF